MAFLFVQNSLNFITFKPAINSNQFHFLFNFGENNKPAALIFGQHSFIFITLQSAIQINQLELGSILGNYQGYTLTFWRKFAHFRYSSIWNQNQLMSIWFIFVQNDTAVALIFLPKFVHVHTSHSAIKINQYRINIAILFLISFGQRTKFVTFNLQSELVNLNLAHFWMK